MHRHVATCNIREEYHGDIDKSLDTKIKIRYPYVVSFFRQQCSTKVCIKAGHYMYTVGAALEGGGGYVGQAPPPAWHPLPLGIFKIRIAENKINGIISCIFACVFQNFKFYIIFFLYSNIQWQNESRFMASHYRQLCIFCFTFQGHAS